jgi:hypothetical protein
MSILLDGGSPTTLASVSGPKELVATTTALYWTTFGGPAIGSVPIDRGPVSVVFFDPKGEAALAVDAHNLYWCGGAGVFRQPLAGGTALSIGAAATAIAVDDTDVYYATGGGTVECVPIRLPSRWTTVGFISPALPPWRRLQSKARLRRWLSSVPHNGPSPYTPRATRPS